MNHTVITPEKYRACVTGGSGFLGRYIVEKLLDRGCFVRVVSRKSYPDLIQRGVEIVQADLAETDVQPAHTAESRLLAATRDIDVVFHVAGLPGISVFGEPYYRTNTLGTENLLRAAAANGVKRFVYTSTASVVFAGESIMGADESLPYPTRWLSHYPRSKALGEQAVLAANGHHGMATCSLRPHLIWGPRDQQLGPRLMNRAKQGKLTRIGNGRNLVDIIYVENAADAHLLAADALAKNDSEKENGSRVAGKSYFISQGTPVNLWSWIDELLSLARLPPVKKSVPFSAAFLTGWGLEHWYKLRQQTDEPVMTRFLASQLAHSHYFDCSAAERDFGFRPKISTEEGMKRLEESLFFK